MSADDGIAPPACEAASQARRARAYVAFAMLVRESVDHILVRIKTVRDQVEVLGISQVVPAEH